jgi:hypothetical protein
VAAFRTLSSSPPPTTKLDHHNDIVEMSTRRSFFSRSLLVATTVSTATTTLLNPSITHAANTNTNNNDDISKLFEDINYGFRITIPSSWERSEQTLSGRRKAIFFTDPTSKNPETGTIETLGYVAYTSVRDDFTNLSSFGSVDEVGQATILPKELAGGDGSTSTMLSAISTKGAYYFDYIASPIVPVTNVNSSGRLTKQLKPQHFRTIFTLLPPVGITSAGMTLVTLTLQTSEERYNDGSNVKGMFDNIINSYEKMK